MSAAGEGVGAAITAEVVPPGTKVSVFCAPAILSPSVCDAAALSISGVPFSFLAKYSAADFKNSVATICIPIPS